jgi:hypothetical protein
VFELLETEILELLATELLEVDEPREELEWTLLESAGNELVPCDEMRAAVITISPTVMEPRTRERFRDIHPIYFLQQLGVPLKLWILCSSAPAEAQ